MAQTEETPEIYLLLPEEEATIDTVYVADNAPVNLQVKTRPVTARAITSRFPTARLFDIQNEYLLPVSYRTKLHGEEYEKGKLTHQNRIKVAVNLPFIRKEKWIVTASARYKYEATGFSEIENSSVYSPETYHGDPLRSHLYVVGILNTYVSTLFDKPVLYNLLVSAEGTQHGIERYSGIALVNMTLKKDDRIAITASLAGFVNARLRFPVLPAFSLDYKISGTLAFSTVLPAFIYIRKSFDTTGRLSAGVDFNSDAMYIYPEGLPKDYFFHKSEMRPGIIYEHYIHDKIILTCKTGLSYALRGQLTEKDKSFSHKIMKSREHLTAYWNIGFSYSFF